MKHDLMQTLITIFKKHEKPTIAHGQSTYLLNQFPFFGITSSMRRTLQKKIFATQHITTEKDLISQTQMLWKHTHRECQYAALEFMEKHKKLWTPALFPILTTWVTTKSWWDTVDTIASRLIGPLLTKYPELLSKSVNTHITCGPCTRLAMLS